MAETQATPANPNPKPAAKKNAPPEERFWKRYSPHHEFPLSVVSSFALHFLGGGGLIFAAVLLSAWAHRRNAPPPIEAVYVREGGGGGDPNGAANGPNDGEPAREEAAKQQQAEQPKEPPKTAEVKPLPKPELPDTLPVPIDKNPEVAVLGGQMQDVESIAKERIRKAVKGKGQGGTGTGGGAGGGTGPGVGDKTGPGGPVGTVEQRQARNRRWAMLFNTFDGNDYLRQLRALGATLAVPMGDQFMVIRDLSNPASGKIEPLDSFQEMYWVDEKPESVRKLAASLKLSTTPSHIAAFFPIRLEQELLKKELEYYHRLKPAGGEDSIVETQFTLMPRPSGGYEPKVMHQRLR